MADLERRVRIQRDWYRGKLREMAKEKKERRRERWRKYSSSLNRRAEKKAGHSSGKGTGHLSVGELNS